MAEGHKIQNLFAKLKRLGSKTKKVRVQDPLPVEKKSAPEADSESFGSSSRRQSTSYHSEMKLALEPLPESEPEPEPESEPEPYGLRRVPTPCPVFGTAGRVRYMG
ncbi:hypothetical protein BDV26DRAFT_297912 [Aspergillus bertholletiae]|uniref:Uncharacterized protein n=1 Tax=Aspergillus bertholletiae TaxID=1226010 RepID=A0A5N7AUC3_9EURO|nr:hypothetical protein BDV26DRAFT_297912 [Aspergillus bertholletiae]